MSLLKHEPDERLTFDEFFAHDFLDLEHAPTKENFDKAVELVQKAVKTDAEGCYRQAYHLYCEALRYFIPILTNEADLQKKEALRLRVNAYIRRAEQLKDTCSAESVGNRRDAPAATATESHVLSRCDSLERNAAINFQELRSLSKSTTGMTSALEIGEVAEQYLTEGNYELALDKFQSCLKILVPLLGKEPPGRRKELLSKQIYKWMKEAESTKALLITKELEGNSQRTSESQEQCLLQ